ncbi:MAG: hypothetical protein ACYTHJ_06275 [Planctomycetota bacterium]
MMTRRRSLVLAAGLTGTIGIWAGCVPPVGNGGDGDTGCEEGSATGETSVSYENDVVPILMEAGCLNSACHGSGQSSGYDARTWSSLFEAGNEATSLGLCPVVPGDPDSSYLIQKLEGTAAIGALMPLGNNPLSDETIELIRTWISEGAADN